MKHILSFLKGLAIGVANIIPGFSGGTMAVILKVYDTFVYVLGNIFSHPIESIKKGWSLFLGILCGFVLAIVGIVLLLEHFPVQTMMFFIGLTLGSLPEFFIDLKTSKKPSVKHIIALVVAIIVLIGMQIINPISSNDISFGFGTCIIVFLLGIICSSAMVIPGISGSLLLMLFGFYEYVMGSINEVLSAFLHFEFSSLNQNLAVLALFGIGSLIGLVGCSKLISYLLKSHQKIMKYVVFGLLVASPIALVISMIKNYSSQIPNVLGWIVAVLSCALGFVLVFFSSRQHKKIAAVTKGNSLKTEEVNGIIDEAEEEIESSCNDKNDISETNQ